MKKLLVILAAVAMLASCAQEPVGELSLSQESVSMDSSGGEIRLNVTSNFSWTGNCGTSDIVMSSKAGEAGTTEVVVTVPGNPGEEERTIEVKFNCEQAKAKLTITQAGSVFSTVVIKHSASVFTAPLFVGSGFTGNIRWGDGKSDDFSASGEPPVHEYAKSDAYEVEVKVHDTSSFTLGSMEGVSSINLEQF